MPNSHNIISRHKVEILLCIAILCNLFFWFSVRHIQSHWGNVPPAPSKDFAASAGLGDTAFSYRIIGLMLQNLGDTGGRFTALKEYNYDELAKWFYIQQQLDPRSNFSPYIAAYYFSASQVPDKIRPLLGYLSVVGGSERDQKWRFLAQAVYLARFIVKDNALALELAKKLAANPNKDMPIWTRNMPAFVLNRQGDKKAAYQLLVEILRSNMKTMQPSEINNMRYYICKDVLTIDEAKTDLLCKDLP